MKKLKLKKDDSDTIVLKTKIAFCNFCGEKMDDCVRGSLALEVEQISYKTKFESILKDSDWKYVRYYKNTSIFCESVTIKEITLGNCFPLKEVIESKETEVVKEYADICHGCIKQLAKLIK